MDSRHSYSKSHVHPKILELATKAIIRDLKSLKLKPGNHFPAFESMEVVLIGAFSMATYVGNERPTGVRCFAIPVSLKTG